MRLRLLLEVTRRFLTPFAATGLLLSTGCASPLKPLTPIIPQSLRAERRGAPTSGVATVGELAAWGLREEAALNACEIRRAAVVAIVDAHAEAVAPQPWWPWRR